MPEPARLPDVPEGTGPCGGCDGVQSSTPQAVHNRQGLQTIQARAGTWAQFRASLQAGLSDPALAPLNALLTRDDRDFSIALIDAFACAADVLSFHSERIAHESYLGTATERVSLQEMGKLIGYRLRPGVAAETMLTFAVETPPQPPAAMAPEPGVFVHGVPDAVPIPVGFKVQSLPGPGEKPQVFETVEPLEARAAWNAMRALPDADVVPGFGATSTWLAGTATQLAVGDMLVFVGPEFMANAQSNQWDARVLTQVRADPAANRTYVAWAEPLGSMLPPMSTASPPTVMALRERVGIFGHNAPDWGAMSDEYKLGYLKQTELSDSDREEWPHFDIYAPSGSLPPTFAYAPVREVADALREVLRGSLLQQAREGAMSVSRLAAGGASLVQGLVRLPAANAEGWQRVAEQFPGALDEIVGNLMAPVTALAGTAASTVTNVSTLTDALNSAVVALTPTPPSP